MTSPGPVACPKTSMQNNGMFGTFRVILAILVVLQHLARNPHFDFGDAAVLNFFMISGYVMAVMIRNNYGKIGKSTLYFYADRFLRIYPQFFFFLVLAQIGDLFWAFQAPYLSGQPSVGKFLLNALVVPLNYHFVFPMLSHYQLILPAWSLGLEEQFYWIFPFLVLIPLVERISAITSFIIFLFGIFGILNPEFFAYRFLPGVIFIFLLGKNLAEYNQTQSKESAWTILILYGSIFALALGLWLFKPEILFLGYNKEVLLSVLVGFPIITVLSQMQRQKWDEFLGHCSYGIFLSHILVKDTFVHFRLYDFAPMNRFWTFIAVVILMAILAGYVGYYLVEKPTIRFRLALRKRHSLSLQATR
jgi:peptidoglycan/LPS O-acetylase OafA/YrhL